jgi:hypothetical protein
MTQPHLASVRPHNMQRRFTPAEALRNVWAFVAPAGTTIEQLAEPSYWAPVAHQVRPLDRIEVVTDGNDFFVELVVLSSVRGDGIVLKPLRGIDLRDDRVGAADEAPKNKAGIRAVHRGPYRKWCAVRVGPDGKEEVLQEEFQTEVAANTWISQFVSRTEKKP